LLLRVQELEAQVRDLVAKLNTNASNSSLPPSANPLGAAKPVQKKKSARRRGAQPGHPPHLKQLLPPERVTHTEHFRPAHCAGCQAPLPPEAGPDDPAPKRFQFIELPLVTATVTEYQAHGRTCPRCGHVPKGAMHWLSHFWWIIDDSPKGEHRWVVNVGQTFCGGGCGHKELWSWNGRQAKFIRVLSNWIA